MEGSAKYATQSRLLGHRRSVRRRHGWLSVEASSCVTDAALRHRSFFITAAGFNSIALVETSHEDGGNDDHRDGCPTYVFTLEHLARLHAVFMFNHAEAVLALAVAAMAGSGCEALGTTSFDVPSTFDLMILHRHAAASRNRNCTAVAGAVAADAPTTPTSVVPPTSEHKQRPVDFTGVVAVVLLQLALPMMQALGARSSNVRVVKFETPIRTVAAAGNVLQKIQQCPAGQVARAFQTLRRVLCCQ